MYHFPELRTKRLVIQLKELSIGDSLAIAAMPTHLKESALTAFLTSVTEDIKEGDTPLDWTVQERLLAISHYMAVTLEDTPDFSLGDAKYTDYMDGTLDIPSSFVQQQIDEVLGDKWIIRHLRGYMVESIERLEGELQGVSGRLHWLIGAMACQLIREVDPVVEKSDFDGHLLSKMQVFLNYPETDFEDLINIYYNERHALDHFFMIDFDDEGIVVLPAKGGDGSLPPAQFPVYSCLSKFAKRMGGKHD